MFSGESAKGLKIKEWVADWNSYCFGATTSTSPSSSMRKMIIDPLVDGDPLFCTVLSIELTSKREYLLGMEQILCKKILPTTASPSTLSSKRTLLCEVIFHLTKCPSPECRTMISLISPTIIWAEWSLSNYLHKLTTTTNTEAEEGLIELLEEDLSSLEVVILAIWQLDFKLSPLPLTCRFIDLRRKATIYKNKLSGTSTGSSFLLQTPYQNVHPFSPEIRKNEPASINLTVRPFLNGPPSTANGPPLLKSIGDLHQQHHQHHFLQRTPKVIDKLDSFTREMVTLRILKLSIDHLPSFGDGSLLTFTFVILKLLNFSFEGVSINTLLKLDEVDGIAATENNAGIFSLFDENEFFSSNDISFTFNEDMLLLLLNLLPPLYFKFPKLEIILKKEIVRYSKGRLFVRPLLSLDDDDCV